MSLLKVMHDMPPEHVHEEIELMELDPRVAGASAALGAEAMPNALTSSARRCHRLRALGSRGAVAMPLGVIGAQKFP